MSGHARWSPSSAKQFINCPPSMILSENFADTSGIAADEGTLAHKIGEMMLRFNTSKIDEAEYEMLSEIHTTRDLYSPEMYGHAEDYCNTVLSAAGPESIIFIEKKVHFDEWVQGGSGTADAIILTPHTDKKSGKITWFLDFYDLKYGKGVPVYAERNEQLMCYALGVIQDFGHLYDITQIRLNIFQPRINNHTYYSLSVDDLIDWAETILRPSAALAWNGEGELKVGDHCKFCKAKPRCSAMAEFVQESIKQDFSDPRLLSDKSVLLAYGRMSIISTWTKSVGEYVLKTALDGKKWPGYKLVEGRSDRKFKDEKTTEKRLLRAGFEDIYTPVTLLGITALNKKIGAKNFNTIVAPTLIKPKGAPTFVPVTDSRGEYNSATTEFSKVDISEIE